MTAKKEGSTKITITVKYKQKKKTTTKKLTCQVTVTKKDAAAPTTAPTDGSGESDYVTHDAAEEAALQEILSQVDKVIDYIWEIWTFDFFKYFI